jgi:hypothetical protein
MPTITADQTARITMQFTQQGQIVQNIYHVLNTDGWTPADLEILAAGFDDWWAAYGRNQASTGVQYSTLFLKDLTSPEAVAIEHTPAGPTGGTKAGAQPPMNVTIAVRWRTALSGRSFRGRTYHIGLVESMLSGSTINEVDRLALITSYGHLLEYINTMGFTMVVLSTRANLLPRLTGLMTPITGVSCDPVTDSQRRRLPGRGR